MNDYEAPDGKRYAVGIEICHILTQEKAEMLAQMIRARLDDMDEDVFICITEYEQVRNRREMPIGDLAETDK